MLSDLLTNPDRFFRNQAEDGGLVGPAVVVALVGVVGALGSFPVIQATIRTLPEEAAAVGGVAYVFGIVGPLIAAFVIWAIYAGSFHAISAFAFDGQGPFKRTLRVTGWGFAPGILAGAISAAVAFYMFQSVAFPSDPAGAQAFAEQVMRRPLFVLSGVLGIVFLLWQAFLWTFAVRHARGITLRESAITVAVPVAVAILVRLFSFV